MPKSLILLLGLLCSVQAQAFPCFLTLVKDRCWANYSVSVVATNPGTDKQVVTASVLQGKSWDRQKFDCQPSEGIVFNATFTPVFWASDTGKVYPSKRNWYLPEAIKKGDTAWNLTICYPSEFSGVPLPPDASGNCGCNTDEIPAIKPQ